ncbi:MAG TPA: hypothetical protein VM889_01705 [Candidatus Thermoplasmatota archaeon]|nr:hypothetical protein [Candidatus Thermoplasmatota archaeon]
MHVRPAGEPILAKFRHENGTHLRLQAFLAVRDGERRVATMRLEASPDAWSLPGENIRLNEAPLDAAKRVAKSWFETPLGEPKLVDVQSYPATGPEDDRWYLILVYEVNAPKDLKGTPDTLELVFTPVGKAPGEFYGDHASVFARLAK